MRLVLKMGLIDRGTATFVVPRIVAAIKDLPRFQRFGTGFHYLTRAHTNLLHGCYPWPELSVFKAQKCCIEASRIDVEQHKTMQGLAKLRG